jgi:hypothetical protein
MARIAQLNWFTGPSIHSVGNVESYADSTSRMSSIGFAPTLWNTWGAVQGGSGVTRVAARASRSRHSVWTRHSPSGPRNSSVRNNPSGLGSHTSSSKPARNSPSLSAETVALTSLRTRSDTPLAST